MTAPTPTPLRISRGAPAVFLAICALTVACEHAPLRREDGGPERSGPLLVPVSYETRLLTARRCQYSGVALAADDFTTIGANVALGYVQSSWSSTTNNVTVGSSGWSHVVALRCPPDLVGKLHPSTLSARDHP
jgi:hypothetical protein